MTNCFWCDSGIECSVEPTRPEELQSRRAFFIVWLIRFKRRLFLAIPNR